MRTCSLWAEHDDRHVATDGVAAMPGGSGGGGNNDGLFRLVIVDGGDFGRRVDGAHTMVIGMSSGRH